MLGNSWVILITTSVCVGRPELLNLWIVAIFNCRCFPHLGQLCNSAHTPTVFPVPFPAYSCFFSLILHCLCVVPVTRKREKMVVERESLGLYTRLDTKEGDVDLYRLANWMQWIWLDGNK